jgi:hypothetical protein
VAHGHSLRYIRIQTNEVHLDTPTTRAIFLPKELHREMFNTFHLNKRSVDAGSIAGSLFWAAEDGVDGDSYLGKCFYLDGHTIS